MNRKIKAQLKELRKLKDEAFALFYKLEEQRKVFFQTHKDLTKEECENCFSYLHTHRWYSLRNALYCEANERHAIIATGLDFPSTQFLSDYIAGEIACSVVTARNRNVGALEKNQEACALLDSYINEARKTGKKLVDIIRDNYMDKPDLY